MGFVDYCSADHISKLEIVDMAKGLKLDVEGSTFWFEDILNQSIGVSKIKNDLDALSMALSMDRSRIANVYIKLINDQVAYASDVVHKDGNNDEGI